MRTKERGQALVLVLILLLLGSLLLIPALRLGFTALRNKQVQTQDLKAQYAMSAGAEYGMWQLLYGGTAALLNDSNPQTTSTININGIDTTVNIQMQAQLGDMEVTGARNNRIRPSKTVVCEITQGSSAFDDNCLTALPQQTDNMRARYTVFLEQVSPDTSVGLTTIYDELPPAFKIMCNNGSFPSGGACASGWVTSADGSFPQVLTVTPTNIGSSTNEIWKWLFSSPVYFQQGEVKKFTFTAQIPKKPSDRYCNGVYLKLQALPNEKGDKRLAQVTTNPSPPGGCSGGGTMVRKYVDRILALPNQVNTFTYIVNIENMDQATRQILSITDVLAQGGFRYCNPSSTPPCDAPRYKRVANPFVFPADGFSLASFGGTVLADPSLSLIPIPPDDNRQKLIWNTPGGSDSSLAAGGTSTDTFILRFQARITPTESGSYWNEIFADVNCSSPTPLKNEGVITDADYCASYSWPAGGVAVPNYDVRSGALHLSGQGNITLDWDNHSALLNSWHIN